MGLNALNANQGGSKNSAVGTGALQQNTTGQYNTAVGYTALIGNTTGSDNIAVGYQAGQGLTTGSGNIYLGALAGSAAESNTVRIGDFGQHLVYMPALIGPPLSEGAPVVVDLNTGRVGLLGSSARYKENVHSLEAQSEGIYRLRPVTFAYKQDHDKKSHFGLIAEEVNEVYPNLVIRDAKGAIETVQYQELTPLLLHEVQRQRAELGSLRAEIQQLRESVGRLRAEVPQVQPMVTAVFEEE